MARRDFNRSRRATLGLMGASALALISDVASSPRFAAANAGTGTFAPLRRSVRGNVLTRSASEFESVRRSLIWNQRVPVSRSPDAIVRVASESDVAAAVHFANEHRLKIALRSGGHNYHAASLRTGGLLLDLGALNTMDIDAKARRMSAGPGVKSGEVIAALAPLGLAFPVGHCSDVSLGGYLLGGGIGWNFGEWGPACMSVTRIQMVNAAGQLIYADPSHNADLFWAARGAGCGFFGAVTRFDLTLYEMPAAVRTLSLSCKLDSAHRLAEWLEQEVSTVHPTVEVICMLTTPGAGGDALAVVLAFAMAESNSAASERFGNLRKPPGDLPLLGEVEEKQASFQDLLQLTDQGFPSGMRMAADTRYCNASLPQLVAESGHLARERTADSRFMTFIVLGGKASPPTPSDSAFAMLGQVNAGAYTFWSDSARDAANRQWVDSVMSALEPHATGSYISEADLTARPGLARRCFSPAAWDELGALKRKHDPDNRFSGYDF